MRRGVAIVAVLSASCSIFGDFSGFSNGVAADAATATSPDGSESGDGGANDGSETDAAGGATFSEQFERPDGPVGNGWLEKSSGQFRIAGGQLHVNSGNWRDFILYRPATEDVRDVALSVEFVNTSTPSGNCDCDPTLVARVQGATVTKPGTFDGYLAYVDERASLVIARIDNEVGNEMVLESRSLPQALGTNDTYRMTLRVTGTSPVALTATAERQDQTGWVQLVQVSFSDSSSSRIDGAGSVGVTADNNATFRYDSFTRTAL